MEPTPPEYRILTITKDASNSQSMASVADALDEILKDGVRNVGLLIDSDTKPYSRTLSLIMLCHRTALERGVGVAVISSDPDLIDLLEATGQSSFMVTYSTEAEFARHCGDEHGQTNNSSSTT